MRWRNLVPYKAVVRLKALNLPRNKVRLAGDVSQLVDV